MTSHPALPLETDALRDVHFETEILMKIEAMNLNIKKVLLGIDPVTSLAQRQHYLPTTPYRTVLFWAENRPKAILHQKRYAVIL